MERPRAQYNTWKGGDNYTKYGSYSDGPAPPPAPITPVADPMPPPPGSQPGSPNAAPSGNPDSSSDQLVYAFIGSAALVAIVTFAAVHRLRRRRSSTSGKSGKCCSSDVTKEQTLLGDAECPPPPTITSAENTDASRAAALAASRHLSDARVMLAVPNVVLSSSTIASSHIFTRPRRGPFSGSSIPSAVLRDAEAAIEMDEAENSEDYEEAQDDEDEDA